MLNKIVYIASLILFLLVFSSCQEFINNPDTIKKDNSRLDKDGQRIPDTYVHGIVYKASNPTSNVIVKLYKGEVLLDQDTTDVYGFYEICVCCHGQGEGTYTVVATKDYKGQLWIDSENFYWDPNTGPWDFDIDLHLGMTK